MISIGQSADMVYHIPRVDILQRREDLGAFLSLCFEEALELEEAGTCDLVLQGGEPAFVKGLNLQLEKLFVLIGKLCNPSFLVEFHRLRLGHSWIVRGFGWVRAGGGRIGLWSAEEGSDGAVDFWFLGGFGGGIASCTFERHV